MTIKEIGKRLKTYDDQLRVKEGIYLVPYTLCDGTRITIPETHLRVERKVQKEIIVTDKPAGLSWEQWHEAQDPNDRYSAQEGYLLCFTFWPNQADNRVFYTILMTDATRMKRRVTEQEEHIKAKRERSRLAFGDMVGYEAKQAYNYMNRVRLAPEGYHAIVPEGGMSIMGGY